MVRYDPTQPLYEIQASEIWLTWHWPFKVTKVKCNRINGLPIYASLFMFNSNIWPNSAPLHDIKRRYLSDLDFDLQGHSRSKVMVSLLSIYGFPMIYTVTKCLSLTFQFIHRVQWWILNFQKKIVTQNVKIQNSTFVRSTQKKIQKKFERIQKWFGGGVAFWILGSHRVQF